MSTTAEVKLWNTTIGAVNLRDGETIADFEYDSNFLKSGIQLSPIMMPLNPQIYSFPAANFDTFYGLPGLLADSLPDKFGNDIIDVWLRSQGRTPESFNPIERLCYIGTRGMGALEFYPTIGQKKDTSEKLEVQKLVELASLILTRRKQLDVVLDECNKAGLEDALTQIIKIGTSAGGARAKALIAYNEKTGEVKSGQINAGKGFTYWLMKFSGVNGNKDKEKEDDIDFGKIEYAYYLMAKACGIDMTECRLFDDGKNQHFMTKRFDRTDSGEKIHMQTLCALGHYNFREKAVCSYEEVFTILKRLETPVSDKEQFFRRIAFNILARNQDDHVKNISFLMDKSGNWKLSPAYDIGFAYDPKGKWTGSHQMRLNGKTDDFTMDDFIACGKFAGLKRGLAEQLVDEVKTNIKNWENFATSSGIDETRLLAIKSKFPVL